MEKCVEALSTAHKVLIAVSITLFVYAAQYKVPYQYSNALLTARRVVQAENGIQDLVAEDTRRKFIKPALAYLAKHPETPDAHRLVQVVSSLMIVPQSVLVDALVSGDATDSRSPYWQVRPIQISVVPEIQEAGQLQVLNQLLYETPSETLANLVAFQGKVTSPAPASTASQSNELAPSTVASSGAKSVQGAGQIRVLASSGAPGSTQSAHLAPGQETYSDKKPSDPKVLQLEFRVPEYDIKVGAILKLGRDILDLKLEQAGRRFVLLPPAKPGEPCEGALYDFGKDQPVRSIVFNLPCTPKGVYPLALAPAGRVAPNYFLSILNVGVNGVGNWSEIEARLKKTAENEREDDPSNGADISVAKMNSSTVAEMGQPVLAAILVYMIVLTHMAHRSWKLGERTAEKREAALGWFDWFRVIIPVIAMGIMVVALPLVAAKRLFEITHPWYLHQGVENKGNFLLSLDTGSRVIGVISLVYIAHSVWFVYMSLLRAPLDVKVTTPTEVYLLERRASIMEPAAKPAATSVPWWRQWKERLCSAKTRSKPALAQSPQNEGSDPPEEPTV
jgi:hypothetical protein